MGTRLLIVAYHTLPSITFEYASTAGEWVLKVCQIDIMVKYTTFVEKPLHCLDIIDNFMI